jgi:hypothetical protein
MSTFELAAEYERLVEELRTSEAEASSYRAALERIATNLFAAGIAAIVAQAALSDPVPQETK